MISIIIPTINEELVIEHCIHSILRRQSESELEIIVVDGGSTDNTVLLAQQYCTVLTTKPGKSIQLNAGARRAQGEILFFLHADATLPMGALRAINSKIYTEEFDGGGFSNVFSGYNKQIKRLGRILNFRIRDNDTFDNLLFFGDNGIFVRKNVFESIGGFPNIPIMEDFEFSLKLKNHFRSVRIKDPKLIISPRRHIRDGFLKTRILWILIKNLYLMGLRPQQLSRIYSHIR